MSNIIEGIILIDVWITSKENINAWYTDVVKNIRQVSDNPYFVNACYNNRWDYNDNDNVDLSQYNTLRLYHELDNQGEIPVSVPSPNKSVVSHIMKDFRGLNTTSDHFKKLFTKQNSICLTTLPDFLFHNSYYFEDQIKNWLIVGQAWGNCVHNRNIGLHNLATFTPPDLNFFVANWSCLDENNNTITKKHIKRDSLTWKKTSNGLYQLVK